jgi:hypothetical protein
MNTAKVRKYRGGNTPAHFARWVKTQPHKVVRIIDGVRYVDTYVRGRLVSTGMEVRACA